MGGAGVRGWQGSTTARVRSPKCCTSHRSPAGVQPGPGTPRAEREGTAAPGTWLWMGRTERGVPAAAQPRTAPRCCCRGRSPPHRVLLPPNPSREHLHEEDDAGKPSPYAHAEGTAAVHLRPAGSRQGRRKANAVGKLGSSSHGGRGGGRSTHPRGSGSRNHLCARHLLGSARPAPAQPLLSVTVPAGAAVLPGLRARVAELRHV